MYNLILKLFLGCLVVLIECLQKIYNQYNLPFDFFHVGIPLFVGQAMAAHVALLILMCAMYQVELLIQALL